MFEDAQVSEPGKNGYYSEDLPIQTELTQEQFNELVSLEGLVVTALELWGDSMTDDLAEDYPADEARYMVDCDLYFEDQRTLELYGASVFLAPDGDPINGLNEIADALGSMVERGSHLDQVAEDEDGNLVLIFESDDNSLLFVAASGWIIAEWDNLPDEE